MASPKIEVSVAALFQVLEALNGPPHLIRELQATRGPMFDNPIDTLIKEYNEVADKNRKED